MKSLHVQPLPTHRQTGATLTEVLMAILIMSIGVVSVVTLFPLAILRAVHASQITNARILEDNIEEFVNTNRWVLNDTPLDPKVVTNPLDTQYAAYATRREACVVDPLGQRLMFSNYTTNFGNRGSTAPGPLHRWSCFDGWPQGAGGADWTPTESDYLERNVLALPDSTNRAVDSQPIAVTATTVTLPVNVGTILGNAKMIVFSADGLRSVSREIQTPVTGAELPTGSVLTLKTTEPNLPGNLDQINEVGRITVEIQESRYSWMLTCLASGAEGAPLSCAIFFRRGYDPEDEWIYNVSPTVVTGRDSFPITWATTDPTPVLREGNYLLDATNARWYRIKTFSEDGVGQATVYLDQPLEADLSRVMFPPGIVHVFNVELRGTE